MDPNSDSGDPERKLNAQIVPSDGTSSDADATDEPTAQIESADKPADKPAAPIPLQMNHHAGLLLFCAVLNTFHETLPLTTEQNSAKQSLAITMLRQFLAQILLGAVNIEQSKLLNTEHLRLLLGEGLYKDLRNQRQSLGDIATDEITRKVLRINAQQVGIQDQSDFYLDPHTKHYTGEKNVLKGWCSGIGRVDKVMHSDFIHSIDGHPVYFETTDNFLDLRERTFDFLDRFRTELEIAPNKVLTTVIDRGIFGAEVFAQVIEHPKLHLITWEKDYRRDGWDQSRQSDGEFVYERLRNHSQDRRPYRFSYQDHRWKKDSRLRRIIVRATNPKGKTIEVAILCDDLERDCQEIILLIFRRWVQENDFKYLHKHYGIDQIISYQAISYENLAEEIEDKQMRNTEHWRLTKQRREVTTQLKTLLLKRERAQIREDQRKERIAALAQQLEASSEGEEKKCLRKQLGSQQGQQKRAEGKLRRWEQDIAKHHKQIGQLSQQLAETSAEQSRLEHLIEQKAVKMKEPKKRLMDALKVLARNVFYIMLAPFKEGYDNFRDDHVIFRNLTSSGGTIEADEKHVKCQLILEPDYPPHIKRHLEEYLKQWNTKEPKYPDGSGRSLTLELTTAEGIRLAPQSPLELPIH